MLMGNDARAHAAARRRFLWPILFVGLAAVLYGGWRYYDARAAAQRHAAASEHSAPTAAPVHLTTVETKPFPIIFDGLGTVQATNTVIVRSRVDGQIESVGFEEGQIVKEGDVLVQIDPAPLKAALDQATAKLQQDQASLTNARQDLDRTTALSKQGNATLQLLDQRTAAVNSLNAQIAADQAAITNAKVQLAYTTIRSPLTGRAGFRLIDRGNIVHANDQNGILTITQLQPISVVFTAPEQQLPAISQALKQGEPKVTAYSSDGSRRLAEGTLKLIDNQVDAASGTIRLKATFDNQNNALWPGLSVSTRLLVSTVEHAIVLSDRAVQRGPDGLYVYVVSPQSTAELRPVTVARTEGDQAMIEKGLSAGERVVISGHYRVVPNGPLQVLNDKVPSTAVLPATSEVD
jgi:multidrug efflux system membrane fusion protein